jgi:O-antigen/teichoic acid export membrane protein
VRERRGEEVYTRLLTYLTLTLTGTAIALVLLARPLIRTLAPKDYLDAAAFVLPLSLAYVLRGVSDQLRSIFNIENRTVHSAQVSFAGFVTCLIFYATLIPAFGAQGAAWATLLGFLVMTVTAYVLSQRVKRHAFEVRRLALLAAVSAAAVAGFSIGPQVEGLVPSFLVGSAWLGVWGAGLFLAGFFTKDERAFFLAKMRGQQW